MKQYLNGKLEPENVLAGKMGFVPRPHLEPLAEEIWTGQSQKGSRDLLANGLSSVVDKHDFWYSIHGQVIIG